MNRLLAIVPKQLQFALILALVVVLTQLLGQAGTTLVDWALKEVRHASFVKRIAEFLVAAACVAAAYLIGLAWPRPSRRVAWIRALVAAVAVVSLNTFLNTVGTIVGDLVGESVLWWGLLLVLLVGGWAWATLVCLPHVQKWFQAQVDRCPEEEVNYGSGHVVLVMLVSRIDEDSLDLASGIVHGRRLAFETLHADISSLEANRQLGGAGRAKWAWQQLMRGIERAVKRTSAGDRTTIVLVGSSGEGGSYRQLETCRNFLNRYPELKDVHRAEVIASPAYLAKTASRLGLRPEPAAIADGGIDFEDFNAVRQHVFWIAHVAACEVGGNRVFVDVTGGQKTTSIAAAVATTGETGFCQYVQTNPPNKVVSYDLHPPELPAI